MIPQPPLSGIKYAGHYWIRKVDADGRHFGDIVLQWNPVKKHWQHSGTLGQEVEPVYVAPTWKVLQLCESPPL